VILTLTVHVPPATIEPPEKDMDALPPVGVKVGVPQPLVVALGVAATTIAPGVVGNVSVKATPVKGVSVLGLVRVKVRVEVPPARMGDGEKAFVILAGVSTTKVAVLLTAPKLVCVVVTPLVVLA
jgi:hypothetical protein